MRLVRGSEHGNDRHAVMPPGSSPHSSCGVLVSECYSHQELKIVAILVTWQAQFSVFLIKRSLRILLALAS